MIDDKVEEIKSDADKFTNSIPAFKSNIKVALNSTSHISD
jgi:hypothetical protein